MRINIITNIAGGKGLTTDYLLLKELLSSWGHEVTGIQYNEPERHHADLNIFCEVLVKELMTLAPANWVFPNPEWWFEEYDRLLVNVDKVLCKTRDAHRIFSYTGKEVHVGFESRDKYNSATPKHRRFLHIAGESALKGTAAVLKAWKEFQIPHQLTVVRNIPRVRPEMERYWIQAESLLPIQNVTVLGRVSDEQVTEMQNSHLFHILPSEYEGWGHCIHEGMGCAACVLTSDAPPMEELLGFHIPTERGAVLRRATLHHCPPSRIAEYVETVWSFDHDEMLRNGAFLRGAFLEERKEFRRRLKELL